MLSNTFVAGNIVLIDAEGKPDYQTRTSVYLLRCCDSNFSPLLASILFFPADVSFPESRDHPLKWVFRYEVCNIHCGNLGFPCTPAH